MDLSEIYKPIKKDLERVEIEFKRQLSSEDEFIAEINGHLMGTSGKRIRPALVLLSAKIVNGRLVTEEIINLASAIELIHTATLIHDDIIDESDLRRKKKTLNSKWGNDISVLVGDYLYSKAFSLLSGLDDHRVLRSLSVTTNGMCEGELFQLHRRYKMNITMDEYLNIIRRKTASLMASCCECGAFMGKADKKGVEFLKSFGMNFGMAFQIVDDCLDIIGDERRLGKSIGSDASKGKLTLPLIYLKNSLPNKEWKRLQEMFSSSNGTNISVIKEAAKKYNAIDYCIEKVKGYVSAAEENLMRLEDSPERKSLIELVHYSVNRKS
ncbi:MAG: polyprenyl synthetase family protein [Candidatus Omnitrophica bacterium]|nr:polyprenyl synthetase family protein [Candidatus Omnitrophota bacterium]